MERRQLFSWLAGLPLFAASANAEPKPTKQRLKIMVRSAWGTDDPTS